MSAHRGRRASLVNDVGVLRWHAWPPPRIIAQDRPAQPLKSYPKRPLGARAEHSLENPVDFAQVMIDLEQPL